MSNPVRLPRDLALEAALRQYAGAHIRWSERERRFVARGRYSDAEWAHELARIALRGYVAELDGTGRR
jgi:hypothetical protein